MRRKAFTLIELLVVIAIIAILAAILFPVFAQAKESAKMASTLSNFNQLAKAQIMYAADYDDQFSSAYSPIGASNAWRWNFLISIPNGWRGGTFNQEPRLSEDGQQWGNSLQPYAKNYDVLESAGMPKIRVSGVNEYGTAVKPWKRDSIIFNGLLHTLSTSEVAQPSRLAMFWQGQGKIAGEGFAVSSPALSCNGTGPCKFSPAGKPQGDANCSRNFCDAWFWGFNAPKITAWAYRQGFHYVATDSSTKFLTIGDNRNGDQLKQTRHPFAQFNKAGVPGEPYTMWGCRLSGAQYSYMCWFRPDTEFDYF